MTSAATIRWFPVLKRSRDNSAAPRFGACAIQSYVAPHIRERDECIWVSGTFAGVTSITAANVEREHKSIHNVARFCRIGNEWQSVERPFGDKPVLTLAASANGEVVGGWAKGVVIWDKAGHVQVNYKLTSSVSAVAVEWTPLGDEELEQMLDEEEEKDGVTVVETDTGDKSKRVKIKSRAEKEFQGFSDSLKHSIYGLRVVPNWNHLDPPDKEARRKAANIARAAKKDAGDSDVEIETESDDDVKMFEDADSIVIDKDELLRVERARTEREQEEKKIRMHQKRYERSVFGRAIALLGFDPEIMSLPSLGVIDDVIQAFFFLGQIGLLIAITWYFTNLVDKYI
eukprot:c19098_g1_i6.p1 GENE.c19098_g1_i6~~c19098_g1_i6.p1  ORF type:complete len:377 (-),score=89.07 c19098_g1_i6:59-1087(-)